MNNLAAFLSGLSGVLLGAGIIVTWLRQLLSDYARLKQKVEEQLERRLGHVEAGQGEAAKQGVDLARRVQVAEERLAPLNVPLLNQQISTLGRQLDAVQAKLDRYLELRAREGGKRHGV